VEVTTGVSGEEDGGVSGMELELEATRLRAGERYCLVLVTRRGERADFDFLSEVEVDFLGVRGRAVGFEFAFEFDFLDCWALLVDIVDFDTLSSDLEFEWIFLGEFSTERFSSSCVALDE